MLGYQRVCEMIGKYGCLALCYLKLLHTEEELLLKHYYKLVELGIIDYECFVLDANKLKSFFTTTKKTIIKDLYENVEEGELFVGKWTNGKHSHWVCMRGEEVVYDPLGNSNTVATGYFTKEVRRLCS